MSPTMSPPDIGSVSEIQAPTFTGLEALMDQLAAAVNDVENAWSQLLHLSLAVTTAGSAQPRPDDRLENIRDALHTRVRSLQLLAEAIRSKS